MPRDRVRVVTSGVSSPVKVATQGPATPIIVVNSGTSSPVRSNDVLNVGTEYRVRFDRE